MHLVILEPVHAIIILIYLELRITSEWSHFNMGYVTQRLCQHVILFLTYRYMYMKRCVHQFQLLKCLFVKNGILFTVRLYDVNTFQCFVGRNPSTHHTLPVTTVSKISNVSCILRDISNLDSRYMYQFKYSLLQKTYWGMFYIYLGKMEPQCQFVRHRLVGWGYKGLGWSQ